MHGYGLGMGLNWDRMDWNMREVQRPASFQFGQVSPCDALSTR